MADAEIQELRRRLQLEEAAATQLRTANAKLTKVAAWMKDSLEESGRAAEEAGRRAAEAEAARATADAARAAALGRCASLERQVARLTAEREQLFELCSSLRYAVALGRGGDAEAPWVDCLPSPCDDDEPRTPTHARGHVTVTLLRAETPPTPPARRAAAAACAAGPHGSPAAPLPPHSPVASDGTAVRLLQFREEEERESTGRASDRETPSQVEAAAALQAAAAHRAARAESNKPRAVNWAAAREKSAVTT